ncbi:hypothetical protein V2O64_13075 [Verrucomicrobiaceae bacterium 227]
MKLRLAHCCLVSGVVCGSALATTVLCDRLATPVLEGLLRPWFVILEIVTPVAWQAGDEILPGMAALLSGLAVSSFLVGTFCVFLRASLKRRVRSVR